MTLSRKRQWLVPAGLIVLSLVPVIAGAVRVTELTAGAEVTAANARFVAAPIPVVSHIIGATIYCLLGAFQFVPRLRRIRWHRISGRLLVPFGLLAALSGLWMTAFYPRPEGDGVHLTAIRYVFGTAMVVSIALGVAAVRRRDFKRHSAWMIRAYAIGIAAGTQVFTHLPWVLTASKPDETARTLAMTAGWVINIAVAEWAIRRRPNRSPRTPVRDRAMATS